MTIAVDRMNAVQANVNISNVGPLSYLLGTGIIPQLLLTLALATTLYVLLMSLELVYKSFKAVKGKKTISVIGSYHPSQQNTFTGKLTEKMLREIISKGLKAIK